MHFDPPLQSATLVHRYKRFLADVIDAQGQPLTIHCPNTGAMTGCAEAGSIVWYSTSDNPKRKYPHTWELNQNPHGFISINAQRANALAKEGIEQGVITELQSYSILNSEVKFGHEGSRIDLQLTDHPSQPDCYVEVKSCTLLEEDGWGYFPDTVSLRGQKHLRELLVMRKQGFRAVLLFIAQHNRIVKMRPATHIDVKYSTLIREAAESGVEILSYCTQIDSTGISVVQRIPFEIEFKRS